MLRYSLDKKCFKNEKAFREAMELVKVGSATASDVRLLINSNIRMFFGDLACYFPDKAIYKKEAVLGYVRDWYDSHYLHYFNILIRNGIITSCGAGYVLDGALPPESDADAEAWEKLVWGKGLLV